MTAGLDVDHAATCIQLPMAAVEEKPFELGATPLHSGFHPRNRQPQALGCLFLRRAADLGQRQSFGVGGDAGLLEQDGGDG